MIHISTLLQYYKRPEIQEAIVACAENKEIAIKYGDKGYGKRPDTLTYPKDIIELAKQGATSFHASEELWKNPSQLDTSLRKEELDQMRKGWDLVLDIDCPILEYSQIGSSLIVKALQHHGVDSVSVKFSGNHGFHIAVPFEAFPEFIPDRATGLLKETCLLFPEGPRRIALYIKEMIRNKLAEEFQKRYDINEIARSIKKDFKDIVKDGKLDPFEILDIDTILISSRHLYRMPYSFNEKSGLISIPIDPNSILKFKKENASPDIVTISKFRFLDKNNMKKGEASKLIVQSFDFQMEKDKREIKPQVIYDTPTMAVPEQFFPPCISNMLRGMEDGKKRSMFIMVNFLVSSGWDYEQIEKLLLDWNKKNKEPLRENLIISHIRYHKQNKKKVLPPNCDNKMYYQDFRVCTPDNLCAKISNPVNYSRRKTRYLNEQSEAKPKRKKPKDITSTAPNDDKPDSTGDQPASEDSSPPPADNKPVSPTQ